MRTKIRNHDNDGAVGQPEWHNYVDDYRHDHDDDQFAVINSLNKFVVRASKERMNKLICILAGAALLAGCEQKDTTVNNPPSTQKDTTVIKEKEKSGTDSSTSTSTSTTRSSPGTSTTTTTTSSSPNP